MEKMLLRLMAILGSVVLAIFALGGCGGDEDSASNEQSNTTNDSPNKKPVADYVSEDGLRGSINGHEWVDLGLPSGTLWATCNVGAKLPTDKGDKFQWGARYANENGPDMICGYSYSEAIIKSDSLRKVLDRINEKIDRCPYSDEPCVLEDLQAESEKVLAEYRLYEKRRNLESWSKVTKKLSEMFSGNVESVMVLGVELFSRHGYLKKEYDAASVNWGNRWRMPDNRELFEFFKNTTRVTVRLNGVYASKYTGPNGNYVIFPSGFKEYDFLHYWHSILDSNGLHIDYSSAGEDMPDYIELFFSSSDFDENDYLIGKFRYIRPVVDQVTK